MAFLAFSSLLFVLVTWEMAGAQRSPYAPNGYNGMSLHPRFQVQESDIGNREDITSSTTTTPVPEEFQDNVHDPDSIKWVSQWPQERQPFWYKNRFAINSNRDRDVDGGNSIIDQAPVRPGFAPPLNNQQQRSFNRANNQQQRVFNQRFFKNFE